MLVAASPGGTRVGPPGSVVGRVVGSPRRARGRRPTAGPVGMAVRRAAERRPVAARRRRCRRGRRRGRLPSWSRAGVVRCRRGRSTSWSVVAVVHRVVVHRLVVDVAGGGVVVLLVGGRPPAVSSVSSSGPSAARHGEAGDDQHHGRAGGDPQPGASASPSASAQAVAGGPPRARRRRSGSRPSASATSCASSTPVTGSRPVVIDAPCEDRRAGHARRHRVDGGPAPPGSPGTVAPVVRPSRDRTARCSRAGASTTSATNAAGLGRRSPVAGRGRSRRTSWASVDRGARRARATGPGARPLRTGAAGATLLRCSWTARNGGSPALGPAEAHAADRHGGGDRGVDHVGEPEARPSHRPRRPPTAMASGSMPYSSAWSRSQRDTRGRVVGGVLDGRAVTPSMSSVGQQTQAGSGPVAPS